MAWESLTTSAAALLVLLVAVPATLGTAGPGAAAVEDGSVNVVVEQAGDVWAGSPVQTDQTAADWYNYDSGSSHNPTGLGDAGQSHLFLLDSQGGINLGVLHNVHGAGPSGSATLAFDGLPDGSWVVEDERGEVTDDPTPSWRWAPERGDGGLFQGGLVPGASITVEPSWSSWDPTWQFASGADGTREITLDQTAPVTMTICPDDPGSETLSAALDGEPGENGWWVTAPVAVSLEAAIETTCDHTIDGLRYQLDDGPVKVYDDPVEVTGDGVHELTYWAVDVDGDASEKLRREVKIDTTPPTVAITDPDHGEVEAQGQEFALPGSTGFDPVVAGETAVNADASDATSGVASVAFAVDGEPRSVDTDAPWSFTWAAHQEPVGPHNVTATATDQAGLSTTDARTVWSVPTTVEGLEASLGILPGPSLPR